MHTVRVIANRGVRSFGTKSSGKVYLVSGKRTPFGKFGGLAKDVTPNDLATISSKAALEDAKIDPTLIDHVIFANVVPATTDTIYGARHVALKVGAKIETPAYSVNRLCGSGIQAIVDAKHMIERGEAHCVLATGVENMSMIPHLTYGTRWGTRFGGFQVVDMLMDSLSDAYCKTPMAITAENLAEKYGITREQCDEFSVESHKKATKAYRNNLLQAELTPVTVKKTQLTKDEHIREDATVADLKKLNSSFKKDGTVTPATASGIVDGAASVVICSESFLQKHGINPLAEIGEYSVVGVDPTIMGIGPVPAIRKLLEKTGKKLSDMGAIEVNEAFAAQVLAVAKELEIDQSILNQWGGAIAIGHPLGASGLRITLTLARQLHHTQKKDGIASACIGGGQGIAIHIKAVV